MSKHNAISNDKLVGGVLLGAVASGLALTALSGAGTAGATCASISGVGNGGGCISTPTSFAIGLGPNTTATADGLFTGAIANGITNGVTDTTVASSKGALSLAYAGGKNTQATTVGNLNVAVVQGQATANGFPVTAFAGVTPGDIGNIAINIGTRTGSNFNSAVAAGTGNIAVNIGNETGAGFENAQAYGTGNSAFNIGDNNIVFAGDSGSPATFSSAFNVGGSNNTVHAGPGPFNIAGLINQTGKNVLNNIH